jgi:bla regulator protein blaR1
MTYVSGVTGSNLKKRIIRIMSERVASKPDLSRKLLLGVAGLVAVTVPIIFGMVNVLAFAQAPAARPEFEVASVKRNLSGSRPWLVPPVKGRFTATNIPLKLLIGVGWPQKVSGGPSWVVTDGYDVSAIAPEPNVSRDEFSLMMQNLLKDRFALRVHTETHEGQVYVLLPAKNGVKLPDAKPEPCLYGWKAPDADPRTGCGGMNVTPESITNEKISMQWFASVLGGVLGRPVLDRTGFTGSFKVRLEFAPVAPGSDTSTKPSIFAALEEQLGLRLESQKGTEEVLVIDHVEKPSPN